MNNIVEKTEFDFITEIKRHEDGSPMKNEEGNVCFDTVKLYTMPYITAKMKCDLDKLFPAANIVSVMKNLSNEKLVDFMRSIGLDTEKIKAESNYESRTKMINDLREMVIEQYSVEPTKQLKANFAKAVEFCLACIDKQRILQQENGNDILNKILNPENWEMQTPKLIEEIIGIYIPRVGETT